MSIFTAITLSCGMVFAAIVLGSAIQTGLERAGRAIETGLFEHAYNHGRGKKS